MTQSHVFFTLIAPDLPWKTERPRGQRFQEKPAFSYIYLLSAGKIPHEQFAECLVLMRLRFFGVFASELKIFLPFIIYQIAGGVSIFQGESHAINFLRSPSVSRRGLREKGE